MPTTDAPIVVRIRSSAERPPVERAVGRHAHPGEVELTRDLADLRHDARVPSRLCRPPGRTARAGSRSPTLRTSCAGTLKYMSACRVISIAASNSGDVTSWMPSAYNAPTASGPSALAMIGRSGRSCRPALTMLRTSGKAGTVTRIARALLDACRLEHDRLTGVAVDHRKARRRAPAAPADRRTRPARTAASAATAHRRCCGRHAPPPR